MQSLSQSVIRVLQRGWNQNNIYLELCRHFNDNLRRKWVLRKLGGFVDIMLPFGRSRGWQVLWLTSACGKGTEFSSTCPWFLKPSWRCWPRWGSAQCIPSSSEVRNQINPFSLLISRYLSLWRRFGASKGKQRQWLSPSDVIMPFTNIHVTYTQKLFDLSRQLWYFDRREIRLVRTEVDLSSEKLSTMNANSAEALSESDCIWTNSFSHYISGWDTFRIFTILVLISKICSINTRKRLHLNWKTM